MLRISFDRLQRLDAVAGKQECHFSNTDLLPEMLQNHFLKIGLVINNKYRRGHTACLTWLSQMFHAGAQR
jgi:hypothetical protein